MTAKEFVLQKYPRAFCTKYSINLWAIWENESSGENKEIGIGTSESNAWVNAKKNIINAQKETDVK